jgi:tRNA (guanine-N7-)-methyltransferase
MPGLLQQAVKPGQLEGSNLEAVPVMKFANWKNQYIDLAKTRPQFLLACEAGVMSDGEREQLGRRVAEFERRYCELGSGSGGHLVDLASRNQSTLCLGFEVRFKRAVRTAEKAEQLALKNLLVVRGDASQLGAVFSPESLDGVFVNFPDPWEKKKWKKHRLLKEEFLANIHRLLKPSGFLSFKTDHTEYFDSTHEIIRNQGLFNISRVTRDLHASEWQTGNIMSEFERLFCSQNLPVLYLECKKIGIGSSNPL